MLRGFAAAGSWRGALAGQRRHRVGVEGTCSVALAVLQFPSVHPADCERVGAGHTQVMASRAALGGVCGVQRRRSTSPGKVTYGDTKPQLSRAP